MRLELTIAIVLLAIALARWRGGGPERAIAGVMVANFVIGMGNRMLRGQFSFENIDPVMFTVDLLTLAALVWIALRANRMWTIVMASLQVIVICAHVAVLAYHGVNQVYWAMMAAAQYVQIPVMIVGTAWHMARVRRIGPYRQWRRAASH
jgi:hypothetical protein